MRRIKKLKEVNKVLDKISQAVRELNQLASTEPDKDFRTIMLSAGIAYMKVSYNMSAYFVSNFMKYLKKDEMDEEFNKLTQDVFKNKDKDNEKI